MPQSGSNKSDKPRTGRIQNDDEPKNNVKLDYSETYHENDQLELSLEDKLLGLHKAKFRSGLEREESFKVAKKAANDIHSLSQAIRRGSIPSSVTLYKQTDRSRRASGTDKSDKTVANITEGMRDLNAAAKFGQVQGLEHGSEAVSTTNSLETKSPTINTLTMFALSLHKFNTSIGRPSESRQSSQAMQMQQRSKSAKTVPNSSSRRRDMFRFRRSARFARQNLKEGEALDVLDGVPVSNYESEDYKKKTKSRRQLQELSKLDQTETFEITSPEDRRRKLYEWAKGDSKALNGRIKSFISDVEDFKRKNKSSDIEIDPSLFSRAENRAY